MKSLLLLNLSNCATTINIYCKNEIWRHLLGPDIKGCIGIIFPYSTHKPSLNPIQLAVPLQDYPWKCFMSLRLMKGNFLRKYPWDLKLVGNL